MTGRQPMGYHATWSVVAFGHDGSVVFRTNQLRSAAEARPEAERAFARADVVRVEAFDTKEDAA